MRLALMLVHTVPGVIGLVAGLYALRAPRDGDDHHWWRRLYTACVALLLAGLVALLAYDWPELDGTARLVFSGLTVLGVVIAVRLALAHRSVTGQEPGWRDRYLDHVVFTYISLWVGFLIVPAINSPLPAVAVPAVVITVPVVIVRLVGRYRPQLTAAV